MAGHQARSSEIRNVDCAGCQIGVLEERPQAADRAGGVDLGERVLASQGGSGHVNESQDGEHNTSTHHTYSIKGQAKSVTLGQGLEI